MFVILYEEGPAGRRAKRLYHKLNHELEDEEGRSMRAELHLKNHQKHLGRFLRRIYQRFEIRQIWFGKNGRINDRAYHVGS
jgi:hypothetical protein